MDQREEKGRAYSLLYEEPGVVFCWKLMDTVMVPGYSGFRSTRPGAPGTEFGLYSPETSRLE